MAQPSNREALIDGAIECLKTKGYAHTTTRDITSASGANLASIGYHFGSKEALLTEALIRILEQRSRHVGKLARASGEDSPAGFLAATMSAALSVFKAPRSLFVAFFEGIVRAESSDDVRERMAGHYRESRKSFAAALARSVGRGDPDVMAALLIALFDGLLLQRLLDANATPSGDQLLAALADLPTAARERSVSRAKAARGRGAGGSEGRRRPSARGRSTRETAS